MPSNHIWSRIEERKSSVLEKKSVNVCTLRGVSTGRNPTKPRNKCGLIKMEKHWCRHIRHETENHESRRGRGRTPLCCRRS